MSDSSITTIFGENRDKSVASFFPDWSALFDIQARNVLAMSEAQLRMFGALQAISEKQAEIFAEASAAFATTIQEAISGCPMCSASDWQKHFPENGYKKAASQFQDIAEIMNKSALEATGIITDRIAASFEELNSTAKKKQAPPKKAA